jgi:hypothetical protein
VFDGDCPLVFSMMRTLRRHEVTCSEWSPITAPPEILPACRKDT